MSLQKYQGTNIVSNSGWKRTFVTHFKGASGMVYRVEIIDSKAGVASQRGFSHGDTENDHPDFLLGPDGCTITYDGSADNTHETILTSKLTLDMVVEGSYHRALFDQIKLMEEGRFGVCLWRHEADASTSSTSTTTDDPTPSGTWALEWVGVLLPEGVEFVDHEVNQMLRLEFSDGLAGLNDQVWAQSNGDPLTGRQNLAAIVAMCLSKIPTSSIFGYAFDSGSGVGTPSASSTVPLLEEEVYYYTTEHDTTTAGSRSMLQNVAVEQSAFYTIERAEDELGGNFLRTEYTSCGEVLKNVLAAFRLRICMSNGRFFVANPTSLRISAYRHTFAHLTHTVSRLPDTQGTLLTQANKTVPFDRNSKSQYVPAKGFGTSFLYPVSSTTSTHLKGGSTVLLQGSQGNITVPGFNGGAAGVYRVAHAADSPVTLTNDAALIDGGESIYIRLNCAFTNLGWYYGQADILDDQFRGCKVMLRMTIKVGDYYLKRDLVTTPSSDHIDVNVFGVANDIEYRDWEQSGDIEWTTTASTYDLIIPFVGCDPEPPVVLEGTDNDEERVGGAHLKLTNNEEEFRFKNGFVDNGTLQNNCTFSISWAPPPPPSGVTHSGIEWKADAKYYNSNNGEITGTELNNGLNWAGHDQCMVFTDFGIFSGDFNEENDVNFYAGGDTDNTANIQVAESILGDKYTQPNARTLQHRDPTGGYLAAWSYTGTSWRSMNGQSDSTAYVHQLNALEGVYERRFPNRIFKGTVVFNGAEFERPSYNYLTGANAYAETIRPFNLIDYTVREGNFDVTYSAYPLNLTWTVRSNSYEGVFLVEEQTRTYDPPESDTIKERLPVSWVPGTKPISGADGFHSVSFTGGSSTSTSLAIKGVALSAQSTANANATQIDRVKSVSSSPAETRVVTVNTSGNLVDLADGSANQYLKTDGSGGLTWASVSASGGGGTTIGHTFRLNASTARDFYIGSRDLGWSSATWDLSNGTNTTSTSGLNALCGFVAPKDATTFVLQLTGIPKSVTNPFTVKAFRSTANAGAKNFSLTSLGSVTSSTLTVNRFFKLKFKNTSAGITEGDFIFVFVGRDGSNGTANYSISYTLHLT